MPDPILLELNGDVVGPVSSVDNSMVLFDGTSGKLIKGNNAVVTAAGLALLDDNNNTEQRNTLGLGSMATQNSNAVTISGGNITGLTTLKCTGTDNSVPTAPAGDKSLKIANTEFVAANGVPVGAVLLWSGTTANIPSGWKLCDGVGTISNGSAVPDLRDRFVVGAGGAYPVRSIGGNTTHGHTVVSNNHTLTIDQMPAHNHILSGNDHETPAAVQLYAPGLWKDDAEFAAEDPDTISTVGGSSPHNHGTSNSSVTDHRPPYYALCYIIKN